MSRALFPNKSFAAFLFDMDGTILTSIIAAERVWAAWARQHGVDVDSFLPTIHGMRAIDTVRRLNLPGVDAEAAAAQILRDEIADVGGIEAIAGAAAFLQALPPERWAIVTSAPKALAMRRLEAAGLPLPATIVTSEDVQRGKPAPDCFLLGAKRLGVAATDCLVFEDAKAGVEAADAAGAKVVVITATHTQPFASSHPTLANYAGLTPKIDPDGLLTV